MFPFSAASLRDKVWKDLADKATGNKNQGWSVYTISRDGSLSYTSGYPNKFSIPGKLVEYWVSPNQLDRDIVVNGLIDACERSGRIRVY